MWPVCHLGLKVSSPEALLGLFVESCHLEAGWVTTMMEWEEQMTRHEVRGQQAVLGWGGKPKESCFYRSNDHSVLFNTATKYRNGSGAGAWRFEAGLKLVWPVSVHEKDCPGSLFELVGLG